MTPEHIARAQRQIKEATMWAAYSGVEFCPLSHHCERLRYSTRMEYLQRLESTPPTPTPKVTA